MTPRTSEPCAPIRRDPSNSFGVRRTRSKDVSRLDRVRWQALRGFDPALRHPNAARTAFAIRATRPEVRAIGVCHRYRRNGYPIDPLAWTNANELRSAEERASCDVSTSRSACLRTSQRVARKPRADESGAFTAPHTLPDRDDRLVPIVGHAPLERTRGRCLPERAARGRPF